MYSPDGQPTHFDRVRKHDHVLPDRLYRFRSDPNYIPEEVERLVQARPQIYHGSVAKFFDPWELKPILESSSDKELSEVLWEAWSFDEDWLFPRGSFSEEVQRGALNAWLIPLIRLRPDVLISQMRDFARNRLREMRRKNRVACFTRTNSDTRMWETYGGWGAGVCFTFELDIPTFASNFDPNRFSAGTGWELRDGKAEILRDVKVPVTEHTLALSYQIHNRCAFSEVEYRDQPASITELEVLCSMVEHNDYFFKEFFRMKYGTDLIHRSYFCKNSSYRDEVEWRYVYKRDEDYSDFSPYRLTCVTLGPKASDELERSISEKLRKSDIVVQRSAHSSTGYDIVPL